MNWLDILERQKECPGRQEVPKYAQIVSMIRECLESGQLADNVKLPTNRAMSMLLGVDRSTVARAYLELEQVGLIESHVGRGTFVRLAGLKKRAFVEDKSSYSQMVWPEKLSRSSQTTFDMVSRHVSQPYLHQDMISLVGGVPTQEFFPKEEFQRIISHLNDSNRSLQMFSYSPAEGHVGLREEVRRHLGRQGIEFDDDELLIVSGSQQAIDVVNKTLIDAGDVVLIEEPTYFWAKCNFSSSQARVLGIPVDEHGIQTGALEAILARQRAKLLYLMPTFQNPTGATLSLERRRRLLELAAQYQVPVLEDNFVGDLRYEGEPLPSLRALDGSCGVVIHQGTFSKALCPGLRLGWLVAPRDVMVRLRLSKRACDLSTNSLAQAVMAEYLRQGHYERHLEHVRTAYRSRRDAMCAALTEHVGAKAHWDKPEGGLFVWVQLPSGRSCREFLPFAEREGVTFSPGDMFFLNSDRMEFFRLSFIQLDEKTIWEGIKRLGRALESYLSSCARIPSLITGGEGGEVAWI